MYEKTLNKPLEFRAKGNASEAAVDVLQKVTSSSAIAERPRCMVGELWPKVEDWNWETIFTNIIFI